jgi:hypothetical protein
VKTKVSNQDDFFPSIDPKKKPNRPEPIEDDWTSDDSIEKCLNCGQIYAYHSPNQALFCAKLIIKNSINWKVVS